MYMILPQQKSLKMNVVRLILLNELHRIIIRVLELRILQGNFHLSFVPLTDGILCDVHIHPLWFVGIQINRKS